MVQNMGTIHPSYHLLNINYLISFIDYIFLRESKIILTKRKGDLLFGILVVDVVVFVSKKR